MKQYHDLCQLILENGVDKDDRTGTGTISYFGTQSRYDLSKGFPLVTTKKMFWKGIVHELLWFLSGSTNINDLDKSVRHWWSSWADRDGNLGPIYGKQFRNQEIIKYVEPLLFSKETIKLPNFNKEIIVDYDSGTSIFLGKTINSSNSGKFTIIKEINIKNSRSKFIIKFHNTGYEKLVNYSRVQSNKNRDPYNISVYNVGCYGEYDQNDPYLILLKNTWRDMLKRCYDKNSSSYKSYGHKGYHVSPEWLIFANFQKDAKTLYKWPLKIINPNEYSLDKDILFASNRYSKETCMWASKKEQHLNTSTNRPFTAINPKTKKEEVFFSFSSLANMYNLNLSAIHRCLNGKLKTHKGWSNFKYIETTKIIRYQQHDQIMNLISEIKNNPESRRLVISLWNPSEIKDMKLPPCHGNIIQFYINDNKLSCHMYQRSGDLFLGIPVNIASYALLTHMIAQVCKLQVGELIHCIGDAHIYKNHLEQIGLQMSRTPYNLPTIKLNPKITNIDDFKFEDIELINYKHHPPIKGDISV